MEDELQRLNQVSERISGVLGVCLGVGSRGGPGVFIRSSGCLQKALGFLSENRTLHSKLQMAEVVQRQAHSAEQDYEEVIHLLEAEIAELKMQLVGKKAKHVSEIEVMQPLSLGKTHNPSDFSVGS